MRRSRLRPPATVASCGLGVLGLAVATAAAAPYPSPGRAVAPVISTTWGDLKQRDAARETDQIIARLRLRPGDRIADVGAGDGYDVLRLARRLGPTSAVVAEDLDRPALARLERAAKAAGLTNLRTKTGAPDDAGLAARSVDAVIMVHMYHEIQHPFALLAKLAPAFRAGGRLGVLELDRPVTAHGTPPGLLRCELSAVGYRQMSVGPMPGGLGYLAVFRPPQDGRPLAPDRVHPCRKSPPA